MILFCYGIPKSGSTLAFLMARQALWLAGHSQALLPEPLRSPGQPINFLEGLDAALLPKLVAATAGRIVAVKTHACPGPDWVAAYARLAGEGLVSAHVVLRDPRDICLALRDAAAAARRAGQLAFAEFDDLGADVVPRVRQYLAELAVWRALPRAMALEYETMAFRTNRALDQVKADLGLRVPNWPIRLYLRWLANTARNRAVPGRHRVELDAAQAAWLTEAFAPELAALGYG